MFFYVNPLMKWEYFPWFTGAKQIVQKKEKKKESLIYEQDLFIFKSEGLKRLG